MNVKAMILGSLILTTASSLMGILGYVEFPGLDYVKRQPNVVVVKCSQTPDPYNIKTNGMFVDPGPLVDSQVEIVAVLKGRTNLGPTCLSSPFWPPERWPHQGDYYLAFAFYQDGCYQAAQEYFIVPLGAIFNTNQLKDKTFDQKIDLLLQDRLNNLNDELKRGQDEKKRLEEELQPNNSPSRKSK